MVLKLRRPSALVGCPETVFAHDSESQSTSLQSEQEIWSYSPFVVSHCSLSRTEKWACDDGSWADEALRAAAERLLVTKAIWPARHGRLGVMRAGATDGV